MKKLLLSMVVVGLVSASAHAGLNLKCTTAPNALSGTMLSISALSLDCVDSDNQPFVADLVGGGLGIHGVMGEKSKFKINCPSVDKEKIMSGEPLKLVSPKVDVGVLFGGTAAVAVSGKGAFCTLVGFSHSVGASVAINYVNISYGTEHTIQLDDE